MRGVHNRNVRRENERENGSGGREERERRDIVLVNTNARHVPWVMSSPYRPGMLHTMLNVYTVLKDKLIFFWIFVYCDISVVYRVAT